MLYIPEVGGVNFCLLVSMQYKKTSLIIMTMHAQSNVTLCMYSYIAALYVLHLECMGNVTTQTSPKLPCQ